MTKRKEAYIKLNIVAIIKASDLMGGDIARILEELNDTGCAIVESTESFNATSFTEAAKKAGVAD